MRTQRRRWNQVRQVFKSTPGEPRRKQRRTVKWLTFPRKHPSVFTDPLRDQLWSSVPTSAIKTTTCWWAHFRFYLQIKWFRLELDWLICSERMFYNLSVSADLGSDNGPMAAQPPPDNFSSEIYIFFSMISSVFIYWLIWVRYSAPVLYFKYLSCCVWVCSVQQLSRLW